MKFERVLEKFCDLISIDKRSLLNAM